MTLYEERQHFTQLWLWVLIWIGVLPVWYGAYRQLVMGRPWGSNPTSDALLLLLWLVAGVALPALFVLAHLRTEVRSDGIAIRFVPLHLRERFWSFEEIEHVEAREYSPLKEYGGWGIRMGMSGWAYNVSGRLGVQLVLRSGKRILIGTQDPEGFMDAVRRARPPAPS